MSRIKRITIIMLMGSGILVGTIVIRILPDNHQLAPFELIKKAGQPTRYLQKGKHRIEDVLGVFAAKQRLMHLMRKDTLTWADSLEIKTIDHHLNQLIHD